ncbi:PH domain-containing protein [Facklamia sp. P12934]
MCNETLTIQYGLFERKVQKIPLNKIQGIRFINNYFEHS